MPIAARSLLIVFLSTVLLATGCGGDGDRASETTLDIGKVIRTAEADKTATTTATIDIEGLGLATPLQVRGEGTTSLTDAKMDLTLDGAPIFERMQVPAEGPVRLIMIGSRVSLDVPEALREQIPDGRRWIGVDLGELAGTGERGLDALMRMDIAGSLAPFEAGASLDEAGEETIGGVETTRWRGKVSVDDYLATLPQEERHEVRASLLSDGTTTDADLAERHPVEVWIDENARVRRTDSTTTLKATKDMPAGKVRFRFDLKDFGEPAEVTAPGDDLVWDATDALTEASAQQAAPPG